MACSCLSTRIEMVLWPHYSTASIEFRTSLLDPWTTVYLSELVTGPVPLLDALDAYATKINTIIAPEVCEWIWNSEFYPDRLLLVESSGDLLIRMNATMAALLGFAPLVPGDDVTIGADDASTRPPLGIANMPVGRTAPKQTERRELQAFRGGRAVSYGYGRVLTTTLTLVHVPSYAWTNNLGQPFSSFSIFESSPMWQAHAAFKVVCGSENPYGEDDLDGWFIAYPQRETRYENKGPYHAKTKEIEATILDPGTTISEGQGTAWSNFWGSLKYGYKPRYWLKREGVPLLFGEVLADAIAPDDYAIEAGEIDDELSRNRGLVIDPNAKVGCELDLDTGLAKAFDVSFGLLPSEVVDALFDRPVRSVELAADVAIDDTSWPVTTSTDGWESSGDLYIGTSLVTYASKTATTFEGIEQGVYGQASSFKKGSLITSDPYIWDGARVDLYAVLMDPVGRYVQGDDILSDALPLGGYYIEKQPYRDGPVWTLECRDQVRRLTQPLGVSASGTAKWDLQDDSSLVVDASVALSVRITIVEDDDTSTVEEFTIRPLAGSPASLRRTEIMARIAAAIDAARTTQGARWEATYRDDFGMHLEWALMVPVEDAVAAIVEVNLVAGSMQWGRIADPGIISSSTDFTGGSALAWTRTNLKVTTDITNAALSVILEDGSAADLPTSGFVLIEGDGNAQHLRYIDLQVDTIDSGVVNLTLDTNETFTGVDVQRIARDIAAQTAADVTVKFYWLDSGRLKDILRRAIVSTGEGINGTYDTLPKGQGLGLPYIEAGSFDEVFDEYFIDLAFTLASEAGTKIEELVSGILRLSRRGLVARRFNDSSLIGIAAINTGSADSYPAATITDQQVVSGEQRPVRVVSIYDVPQSIQAKCRTIAIGDVPEAEATLNSRDPWLKALSKVGWKLDIYGIRRRDILQAFADWSLGWYRSGRNRQVVQVDVGPEHDLQAGSSALLDLVDPATWSYAEGHAGITSPARVLGWQMSLASYVQTFLVVVDGIYSPGPMSPSLVIDAVNGTATNPTSIDVSGDVYALLEYAQSGETTWRLLAYLPGEDAPNAEYVVSDVADMGSGIARITVATVPSSPTVTLTTSYRMTWPVSARATEAQNTYLHSDQQVQWGG